VAEVHAAGEGDAAAVLEINRAGTAVHHAERIAYLRDAIARGACVVAVVQGKPAGFAVWDASFYGYPFVWLLAVRPEARRRGVATALMRYIERACDRDRVFTSTNASNAPMRALCEALGYAPSGRIDNLDPGDPELVFCRRLSPPAEEAR
jgi:GNAT superfamily N-acetyltransferase